MKRPIILLLFILLHINSYGQWNTEWTRYSDDGTQGEYYHEKLLFDGQGFLYCLGRNKASTNVKNDILIVKYDTLGNEMWKQTYSRPGDRTETIQGATIDHNGDLIFTGECFNTSNVADVLIAKYSSSGQLLWSDSIDGTTSMYDKGFDICVDDSNNLYLTGYLYNGSFKGFLSKYSPNGVRQYLITLPNLQQGHGIQYKNNRLLLYGITGASGSPAHTELFKLDLSGNIQNTYYLNDAYTNSICSILENDSFIYLVDNRGSGTIGYANYSVHCIDTSFTFVWRSDQVSNNHLGAITMTEHDSSLYISAHHTVNSALYQNELDFRKIRKADGFVSAQNTFNNSATPNTNYASHVSDSQGNFTVSMMSNGNLNGTYNFQISRYDHNLQYQSMIILPDSIALGEVSIVQPSDHTFYFASQAVGSNNNNDLLLAKFSDIQVGVPISDFGINFYLFPNPCTNEIYINPSISGSYKWQIINELGQLIMKGNSEGFESVSTHSLESGIYYLQVIHSKGTFSKSILKIND